MNVHKNARTCPASRALLFKRVSEQGWSVHEASAAAGISDRRGREWIRRASQNEPLTDRSSRPHSDSSTKPELRAQIIALRKERRTVRQIAILAGVSLSTVARICRSQGLSRLGSLEPAPPPKRYERDHPGELLHVDIKRLGRFDRVGHRITRNRSFGSKKQGFEFVYVATDDASRLTYAEIHEDERSEAACTFLKNAVRWFGGFKIDIERVMTDNGSAFVGRQFGQLCSEAGIKHKRTKPYTPRTNGKVERFIQTMLREWAYRFSYANSDERRQWLTPYLHFYNYHRAHSALDYNPPISRLDRNNLLTRNS